MLASHVTKHKLCTKLVELLSVWMVYWLNCYIVDLVYWLDGQNVMRFGYILSLAAYLFKVDLIFYEGNYYKLFFKWIYHNTCKSLKQHK